MKLIENSFYIGIGFLIFLFISDAIDDYEDGEELSCDLLKKCKNAGNHEQSEPGIKFQLISDIHLQFSLNEQELKYVFGVQKTAPLLILAGDIGNPFEKVTFLFLKQMSMLFDTVVLVAGNHQFYRNEYFRALERLRLISNSFKNVQFLENEDFIYTCPETQQSVRILGCTLWTNVPQKELKLINKSMRDYSAISFSQQQDLFDLSFKRKFTVFDSVQIHLESVQWIENTMEQYSDQQLFLVTHHAVFMKGSYKKDDAFIKHACSTDLTHLMGQNIKTFVYGHTHKNVQTYMNGSKIITNQLGYIVQNQDTSIPYEMDKAFEMNN